MAKFDLNKESDIALRKGNSAVYASEKAKKSMKEQLSNDETKQATMDFIFGKSEENPIKR
jgi:hypothetical protein